MASVTDMWTTGDIVARVRRHRSVVLRHAAKHGIVPRRFATTMLFTKEDAERLIKILDGLRRGKSP